MLAEAYSNFQWLKALPERVQGDDLARVEAIYHGSLTTLPLCTDNEFAKYIRIMQANLKARSEDNATGKLLLRTYHSCLGHYPGEAIKWMAKRCIDTMVFFPTISECHDVLGQWNNPLERPVDFAGIIIKRQRTRQFDEVRDALRAGTATQDQVDALPERWRSILMEQDFLRFDGERPKPYVIRERKAA